MIIYVCKCIYKKRNPHDNSRSSSFDSEYGFHHLHSHNNTNSSLTLEKSDSNGIAINNNLEGFSNKKN